MKPNKIDSTSPEFQKAVFDEIDRAYAAGRTPIELPERHGLGVDLTAFLVILRRVWEEHEALLGMGPDVPRAELFAQLGRTSRICLALGRDLNTVVEDLAKAGLHKEG